MLTTIREQARTDKTFGLKVASLALLAMFAAAGLAAIGMPLMLAVSFGFLAWVVFVVGFVIQVLIRIGKL